MSDDATMLAAWRDGDEEAGRALLVRHFKALSRFFRNKATGGVEDLIQRTMLVCLENADRLREASSFRAYLFTIARNELYRHYRRGRRDALDTSLHSVHDLQPSYATVLARREEERLLLTALRRLPIDLQVTVELFYWEGLTYAELGEVLGVHRETIKSRLRRAKDLLRASMAEAAERGEVSEASIELLDDWARGLRAPMGGEPDT
ncbi:MAG: RNA polymerase sigma factor [Deltaproteobacteria bacterium]|nr:RNA polymerase sigma factor [Deltaproteobacteria bacterium]